MLQKLRQKAFLSSKKSEIETGIRLNDNTTRRTLIDAKLFLKVQGSSVLLKKTH